MFAPGTVFTALNLPFLPGSGQWNLWQDQPGSEVRGPSDAACGFRRGRIPGTARDGSPALRKAARQTTKFTKGTKGVGPRPFCPPSVSCLLFPVPCLLFPVSHPLSCGPRTSDLGPLSPAPCPLSPASCPLFSDLGPRTTPKIAPPSLLSGFDKSSRVLVGGSRIPPVNLRWP